LAALQPAIPCVQGPYVLLGRLAAAGWAVLPGSLSWRPHVAVKRSSALTWAEDAGFRGPLRP